MVKTIAIQVDVIPTGGGYYTLGNFSGTDPGKLSIVDIQVSWSGLDATNGLVTALQRHTSDLNWTKITYLTRNLNPADDSENLVIQDFSSGIVGLFINKGTATTGTIYVRVNARKYAGV